MFVIIEFCLQAEAKTLRENFSFAAHFGEYVTEVEKNINLLVLKWGWMGVCPQTFVFFKEN